MKIEIWSDIACPFCYIGKAHLEKALEKFQHKSQIEVIYRSYQLDPDYYHSENDTAFSILVNKKHMPIEQVKGMAKHIENMASKVGITMDIEKSVPANTHDAHRLIHLAEQYGKEKELMTGLFKSHFTLGENIEKREVLEAIALEHGIEQSELNKFFESDIFADKVANDILASRSVGVRGVPFFVIDRKYSISGAQPIDNFVSALEQSFLEWEQENPRLVSLNGREDASCGDDGCEI